MIFPGSSQQHNAKKTKTGDNISCDFPYDETIYFTSSLERKALDVVLSLQTEINQFMGARLNLVTSIDKKMMKTDATILPICYRTETMHNNGATTLSGLSIVTTFLMA